MLSYNNFILLYQKVSRREIKNRKLSRKTLKSAERNLSKTYKLKDSCWNAKSSRNADYNNAAHRCAYLCKYAPIHSFMVKDALLRAFKESGDICKKMFLMSRVKICCLGGGPGVDVVGVMSALHKEFGLQHCSVQVIDSMVGWKNMFKSVLKELQVGYGNISKNFDPDYLQHSFIVANLLGEMNTSVVNSIRSANLVTMIKFVSAATCKKTEQMVRRIFNSMKNGAFLLFIDNATGGYVELVSRIGKECKMLPAFGPLKKVYSNKVLRLKCGYQTRVSILLLRKCVQLKETKFLSQPLNQYKKNEALLRKCVQLKETKFLSQPLKQCKENEALAQNSSFTNLQITITPNYAEKNYDDSHAINQYYSINENRDKDYRIVEHYSCYDRGNGSHKLNHHNYTNSCEHCGEVTANCVCYNHSNYGVEHNDRVEYFCNRSVELDQSDHTVGCQRCGKFVNCGCYNRVENNGYNIKRYYYYDRNGQDYRNSSDELNQYDCIDVQCMCGNEGRINCDCYNTKVTQNHLLNVQEPIGANHLLNIHKNQRRHIIAYHPYRRPGLNQRSVTQNHLLNVQEPIGNIHNNQHRRVITHHPYKRPGLIQRSVTVV